MESLSSSLKKKATEHHYRAEVMIAGEQLRLRLHDGKLVKDRRYHLRTYPNCFVAKELTDWLVEHKDAPDRETAIRLMQKLMDHYIIHHVCDEHSDYKDAKLLYRFRKDDGTFPLSKDVKVFMRGQSLYEKLVSMEESILKVREENSVKYQRTFLGSEMIDWLIQEGEVENRQEAVELGRALLEHGIIQHVTSSTTSGSTFGGGGASRSCSMKTLPVPSPRALTAPSAFASSTQTQATPASSLSRPARRSKLSQQFEGAASRPSLETPTPTSVLLLPCVKETRHQRGAAVPWGPLCQENADYRGGCSGLGVCGSRRKTLPHPGSGPRRTCCCCRDEGVPVCFLSEWGVRAASGLPDHQQPHHDRTTDSGDGGHGGH
ncbi:DEP domain-containing mTOR-interacting protein-like isoform X1 [Prinia subflava]|uniref:DEP domain-containing mTOR-interacting protein-like isoform X1 n=1 Tax=Prinia subflava TaxID=208062 RepID=UPI002FE26F77